MVVVRFKRDGLDESIPLPSYAKPGDAGMDLPASEDVYILPGTTKLISTGLRVILPPGFEAQVRSRSGLALKHDVFVLNSPGTVDNGYNGIIGVVLRNEGNEHFSCEKGKAIAQLVIAPITRAHVEEWVGDMPTTDRGGGGFGSSGR